MKSFKVFILIGMFIAFFSEIEANSLLDYKLKNYQFDLIEQEQAFVAISEKLSSEKSFRPESLNDLKAAELWLKISQIQSFIDNYIDCLEHFLERNYPDQIPIEYKDTWAKLIKLDAELEAGRALVWSATWEELFFIWKKFTQVSFEALLNQYLFADRDKLLEGNKATDFISPKDFNFTKKVAGFITTRKNLLNQTEEIKQEYLLLSRQIQEQLLRQELTERYPETKDLLDVINYIKEKSAKMEEDLRRWKSLEVDNPYMFTATIDSIAQNKIRVKSDLYSKLENFSLNFEDSKKLFSGQEIKFEIDPKRSDWSPDKIYPLENAVFILHIKAEIELVKDFAETLYCELLDLQKPRESLKDRQNASILWKQLSQAENYLNLINQRIEFQNNQPDPNLEELKDLWTESVQVNQRFDEIKKKFLDLLQIAFSGFVDWFNPAMNIGHIKSFDAEDAYFHLGEVSPQGIDFLELKKALYQPIDTYRGVNARNIHILFTPEAPPPEDTWCLAEWGDNPRAEVRFKEKKNTELRIMLDNRGFVTVKNISQSEGAKAFKHFKYSLAINPGCTISWKQYDFSKSIYLGLKIFDEHEKSYWLCYIADDEEKRGKLSFITLKPNQKLNSWQTFERNIYNDFLAMFKSKPIFISELMIGHFCHTELLGDQGGIIKELKINLEPKTYLSYKNIYDPEKNQYLLNSQEGYRAFCEAKVFENDSPDFVKDQPIEFYITHQNDLPVAIDVHYRE